MVNGLLNAIRRKKSKVRSEGYKPHRILLDTGTTSDPAFAPALHGGQAHPGPDNITVCTRQTLTTFVYHTPAAGKIPASHLNPQPTRPISIFFVAAGYPGSGGCHCGLHRVHNHLRHREMMAAQQQFNVFQYYM